ncbi:MAG TPA: sodium:proton antiporter [Methyloceanibacter sp.]|nr:sodium:proton antiporter [Methyloceanibacter sp.]
MTDQLTSATDRLTSSVDAIANGVHLDGLALSLVWSIPFAGLLLSIALLPLIAPHFWEHHFGKVAAFWAIALLVPCTVAFGFWTAAAEALRTFLLDYLPFIILLFTLFVVAGGIKVSGNLVGTPGTNTAMLAFGTLSANLFGTTGASMLLIRLVIGANQHRKHTAHVFVFFIFLVANIGGSLTPFPPLYLGFLKGVDFLWTFEAILLPMLLVSGVLLCLFYVIDRLAWNREAKEAKGRKGESRQLRIDGLHNVLYLAAVALTVLASGIWKPSATVGIGLGIELPAGGLIRDAILIVVALLSWKTTKRSIRVENAFTWAPMQEVAMLFAAIFITMTPMLAMLRAGAEGPLAPLLGLVSTTDGKPIDAGYFWLTGILSSFLDNAPTYLAFFNLAGGDAQALMGPLHSTLLAISIGAVFMGANTYIGNAPNFMVRSICEERGIKMPSFFGYLLWSGAILLPLFLAVTLIWFR